jgi:hypothetical protein
LNFLDRFFKNTQILNFIKLHPMGDELFHVEETEQNRTEQNRIEYRGAGTTLTHALRLFSIFCATLQLSHSAVLHLGQSAVSH